MKYVILTNFDDYDYNLSCDKFGVFTFKLTPKYVDDILLKDSFIRKKGRTFFDKKYCTIYHKKNNEYLFKFTNHSHSNSYDKQKINLLEFNFPTNRHSCYKSKFRILRDNYYNFKLNRLNKKCFDLRNKIYN